MKKNNETEKNILFINSAVMKETRTEELAQYLLSKLKGKVTELRLEKENFYPINKNLLVQRDIFWINENFDEAMFNYAKQFADADTIVISAPLWDTSMPVTLRSYIENITTPDATFTYGENGEVIGLCNAKQVYVVISSGGLFINRQDYNYIELLFRDMFDIHNFNLVYVENLDVRGQDINKIIEDGKAQIDKLFEKPKENK